MVEQNISVSPLILILGAVLLLLVGFTIRSILGFLDGGSKADRRTIISGDGGTSSSGARIPGDDPALRAEVLQLLSQDQMIPAVKLVRERTGLGLAEAKNVVDGLRRQSGR